MHAVFGLGSSFDPAAMWMTLNERVNTADTSVGQAELYNAFNTIKPISGQPITDIFTQLLEIRNQNIGTDEAISDMMFKSHVYHTLPAVFDITVQILHTKKNLRVGEMIDALKGDETFHMLKSSLDGATHTFYMSGPSQSLRNKHNN
jgi:hypothetical protein